MRNKERTNNTQAHDMDDHVDVMTRTNTLSHAVRCATMSACSLHENKVTCEVYRLHPRRLQQIAISCKRNLLQQTIKNELNA